MRKMWYVFTQCRAFTEYSVLPRPGEVLPRSMLSSYAAEGDSCSARCAAWPLLAGKGAEHFGGPVWTLPLLQEKRRGKGVDEEQTIQQTSRPEER